MSDGAQVVLVVMGILVALAALLYLWTKVIDGDLYWLIAAAVTVFVIAAPLYVEVNRESAADAKPFDGYVYKKTAYPGYWMLTMAGKVPITQYIPPRWNVVLKSTAGNDERSCDVPESEYDATALGVMFHCGGF